MNVCLSCHHRGIFHRPAGNGHPCYICPPNECLVSGCECKKYDGEGFGLTPHEEHEPLRMSWGTWGVVTFVPGEEQMAIGRIVPSVTETPN